MISVQHNMLAGNASRQLKTNTKKNAKSAEKLSSGYKINRSADDAAGLSISEKMRRQIRGLNQSVDNIQEGIGYVKTAEGALNEVQDMLHRMNELAVQAANGTNTEIDREYIDQEVQALKEEMDRIFENTTFNEQKIWEPKYQKQIGTEKKLAVNDRNTYNSMTVTNDNYDVIPCGSFTVNADTTGVNVSWTGYDGKAYATEKIDWETLKNNNYSFEMSDYFGAKDGANAALYDGAGNPVFTHEVAFAPIDCATKDQIISCINGQTMSCSPSVYMDGTWEDGSTNGKFSIISESLSYPAAYASKANDTTNGHNFDAGDDIFLEPSKTVNGGKSNLTKMPTARSVDDAKTDSTGWTFDFEMKGIGKVKANSTSITYYSNDYDEEDEGRWWEWCKHSDGTKHKSGKSYSKTGGTLSNVMSALVGDNGLLAKKTTSGGTGMNDGTGTIEINFSLSADTAYNYGKYSSQSVGSFALSFNVSQSDTEASILSRIENALNNTTILDFHSQDAASDRVYFYALSPREIEIDTPIWGGTCGFFVQGGTESGQHIEVMYDALSVIGMGMADTNVLTVEDSGRAIDEIKAGLEIISEQRATFGAYQNRLEHAYKINENVEENTQASESVIRDTDIAKTMVEYSNSNILMQAGTSILAQANQQPQYILSLLQ